MKLLFVSDIHGSKFYTEKLINIIIKENIDKIILLGDLLYHGPRNPLTKDYNPIEVANILNNYKEKIIAVRGNCDSEVDQMVLEFPMMSDYTQVLMENFSFFLTHGHIHNLENLPKLSNNTIFVFGHIHVPILKKQDNIVIFNPGSLSLPKDNNPSSYAIYEEGFIKIKNLEGLILKELKL